MLTDLYRRYDAPLDHETLASWHRLLMQGRTDLAVTGGYRRHPEPMQVVSGAIHAPKIHFEAPPSAVMAAEMERFMTWFNLTAPGGPAALPALTRAGIAHLYFVSIHPFEDGNGRIGRAIAEKALTQSSGQPSLNALSLMIHKRRSGYYEALERANQSLVIDDWLAWVEFLIARTRLLDRLRDRLNERQTRALLRMMREGPEGFRGGLSAGNYSTITGAPPATARRDLVQLVEWGALLRTGEQRGTRYWLPFVTKGDQ